MKKSLLLKNYIQELSNLTVTLEIERKQKDIIKSNRKRFKSKLYKLNQSIDFISNCSSVQDAVSYLIKERDELLLYESPKRNNTSKTSFELDAIVKENQAKILALNSTGTSTSGTPTVVVGNNNDSSVKSQTSNSVFAGLTVGNPNNTAEIINKRYLVAN